MRKFHKTFSLLALLAGVVVLTGCAHGERDPELSERPWNSPKGWEHGVPGSVMRGR